MWLWHRPATAVLIPPQAWELAYATAAARQKKKKIKKLGSLTTEPRRELQKVNFNVFTVSTVSVL